MNAWSARAARIVELRKQVTQGKQLLVHADSYRARWEQMRRNTLPANTSAAEQQLFHAIDGWAQDSRVVVNAVTPQWKHDSDEYMTYQCRVDASGNIQSLSKFLYDIEKEPMALKPESIEITARDKDGQQLVMGLQLSGLVLTPTTR